MNFSIQSCKQTNWHDQDRLEIKAKPMKISWRKHRDENQYLFRRVSNLCYKLLFQDKKFAMRKRKCWRKKNDASSSQIYLAALNIFADRFPITFADFTATFIATKTVNAVHSTSLRWTLNLARCFRFITVARLTTNRIFAIGFAWILTIDHWTIFRQFIARTIFAAVLITFETILTEHTANYTWTLNFRFR